MANELTDLDLKDGEFSICFADLGGPANEECSIEIVKSKSGLVPILKETDMSDKVQKNDEAEGDADFESFVTENGDTVLGEFNELSADDQASALLGLAYENAVYEDEIELRDERIEEAADVIKSLSENVVPRATYEELKKSAGAAVAFIEKAKAEGRLGDDSGMSDLRKSLTADGAPLSPEADARLTEVEKALAETAKTEAVNKAKTYGFGKAEDVADLEIKIRKSLGAKDADTFVDLMKRAGQAAKNNPLFKAIGEGAATADANSPIAKAKDGIEAIQKANPNMTYAQAQTKFYLDNPDIYEARNGDRSAA